MPGVNLPEGWRRVPPELACVHIITFLIALLTLGSFLYWFFSAQDANFRLKGRQRITKMQDITLSPGWSYFVETKSYIEYVSKFANQEEVCPLFSL